MWAAEASRRSSRTRQNGAGCVEVATRRRRAPLRDRLKSGCSSGSQRHRQGVGGVENLPTPRLETACGLTQGLRRLYEPARRVQNGFRGSKETTCHEEEHARDRATPRPEQCTFKGSGSEGSEGRDVPTEPCRSAAADCAGAVRRAGGGVNSVPGQERTRAAVGSHVSADGVGRPSHSVAGGHCRGAVRAPEAGSGQEQVGGEGKEAQPVHYFSAAGQAHRQQVVNSRPS